MSIVRTMAIKYDYATDSNQELVAFGFANLAGAFFSAYPAAGSLSRSALVATSCGASCSPMHGVWTALIVLLVLVALTPAFRTLPYAASPRSSLHRSRACSTLARCAGCGAQPHRLCSLVGRLRQHPNPRRQDGHCALRDPLLSRAHLAGMRLPRAARLAARTQLRRIAPPPGGAPDGRHRHLLLHIHATYARTHAAATHARRRHARTPPPRTHAAATHLSFPPPSPPPSSSFPIPSFPIPSSSLSSSLLLSLVCAPPAAPAAAWPLRSPCLSPSPLMLIMQTLPTRTTSVTASRRSATLTIRTRRAVWLRPPPTGQQGRPAKPRWRALRALGLDAGQKRRLGVRRGGIGGGGRRGSSGSRRSGSAKGTP